MTTAAGPGRRSASARRADRRCPATAHDAVPESTRQQVGVEDVRRAEEARDVGRRRHRVDLRRRADLLDPALGEHGDPVAHRQRFLLVVRDVDERDADLALQRAQLELQLLAQLRVERAERLVEQQHPRVEHERAGQRHALLLAAGQLGRAPRRRSRPSG